MKEGETVAVRCVHKIFEDVFDALREAGFQKFPELKELTVTEELLQQESLPRATSPFLYNPLAMLEHPSIRAWMTSATTSTQDL